MQKTKTFFYDSYAILAYLSGNPKYTPYFEEHNGFMTKLNLLEVYYRTLEVHGTQSAKKVAEVFGKYVVDFGLSEVEGSMKLRLKLKKDGCDISYADALGYYLALSSSVKFLTGDKWFKGLKGVEFVE